MSVCGVGGCMRQNTAKCFLRCLCFAHEASSRIGWVMPSWSRGSLYVVDRVCGGIRRESTTLGFDSAVLFSQTYVCMLCGKASPLLTLGPSHPIVHHLAPHASIPYQLYMYR